MIFYDAKRGGLAMFFLKLLFLSSFSFFCFISNCLSSSVHYLSTCSAASATLTDGSSFFDRDERVRAFCKTNNFTWLVDGLIAGMQQPEKSPETLDIFGGLEVGAVFALNGDSWDSPALKVSLAAFDIEHHSNFLPDPFTYSPAAIATVKDLLRKLTALVGRMREAEKSVIVHCNEGVNRTWAVLGCFFILHHPLLRPEMSSNDISQLRQIIGKFITARGKAVSGFFLQNILCDKAFFEEIMALRSQEIVAAVAQILAPLSIGQALSSSSAITPVLSPGVRPMYSVASLPDRFRLPPLQVPSIPVYTPESALGMVAVPFCRACESVSALPAGLPVRVEPVVASDGHPASDETDYSSAVPTSLCAQPGALSLAELPARERGASDEALVSVAVQQDPREAHGRHDAESESAAQVPEHFVVVRHSKSCCAIV